MQAMWVQSLFQEDPLEKEMAVLLPGEAHGQGSLAATVHGVTELDMTEQLSHHL